jgi:putative membrane protein
MGAWGWAGFLVWAVVILAVVGGLSAVIIASLRRSAGPGGGGPEQILGERFARGEIDEDEYHRRLRALRS